MRSSRNIRFALISLLVFAAASMPARADTEVHTPPWSQQVCTKVGVSVTTVSVYPIDGCGSNGLAFAGVVLDVSGRPFCVAVACAAAYMDSDWATDSYLARTAGTGRIEVVSAPLNGVCLRIGTRAGTSEYGSGCGRSVPFTVPYATAVTVTMVGTAEVLSLAYTM